jgi:hypothetical protein
VVEPVVNLFKLGFDTLDSVQDSAVYRRVSSIYTDGVNRLVNIRRSGVDEPASNLFKRGVDTLGDVQDSATFRRVRSTYIDTANRLVNIRRSGVDEPASNLFKRGVDTLGDVQDSATFRRIGTAFSDASNRLTGIFRGGVTEPAGNLFKRGVDSYTDVVGAESTSGAQDKANVAKQGALYSVEAASLGNNLVYNPSFEIDRDGDRVPDGWEKAFIWGGAGISYDLPGASFVQPRHGNVTLYMTPKDSTSGGAVVSKAFRVVAGDNLSALVDSFGVTPNGGPYMQGFYFRVFWYGSGTAAPTEYTSFADIVVGTDNILNFAWLTSSGKVKVPAGSSWARVALYVAPQSNGYGILVDNLRVYSQDIINSRGAAGQQWILDYNNDPSATFPISYSASGSNYIVSWSARTFRNGGEIISIPSGSFVSGTGKTWYLYWDGDAGAVAYSESFSNVMSFNRMYLGKVTTPSTAGAAPGTGVGGTGTV